MSVRTSPVLLGSSVARLLGSSIALVLRRRGSIWGLGSAVWRLLGRREVAIVGLAVVILIRHV